MKGLLVVKKFIDNNDIDLSGTGSSLNGNCTVLAGFICYVVEKNKQTYYDGNYLIHNLKLTSDVETELYRVYDYAYRNNYEKFWKTSEAKTQYTF